MAKNPYTIKKIPKKTMKIIRKRPDYADIPPVFFNESVGMYNVMLNAK